eukprot:SAG22_NODE_9800_length_569_cov_0.721277_2_plen_105_part_01
MNCLSTSAYVLSMARKTKHMKLSKFGMVFYNNLLSCVALRHCLSSLVLPLARFVPKTVPVLAVRRSQKAPNPAAGGVFLRRAAGDGKRPAARGHRLPADGELLGG